jgi:RNA-directed DNA polymerase
VPSWLPPESDSRVVPVKRANNTGRPVAEPVEERRLAKGNTDQQNASRTLSRDNGASSALDRVRQAARKDKKARFTALLHHVDLARLWAAYAAMRTEPNVNAPASTWD